MKLRDKRIVVSNNQMIRPKLTLIVGIFNGSAYLDSIKKQLIGQITTDFNLVVVDNCSSDESWGQLQSWLIAFEGRVTLVKNPINLGFVGSMHLNQDLIDSEWVLQIHQDDYYFKNHVQVHLERIRRIKLEVIAISTDMGSMSNDGRNLPTLPRASWFPVEQDAPSQFIQNLIAMSIPWPATSFRTKEFFESFVPWHNQFSDVEITLRILSRGKVLHVKRQTMKYRENPMSDSHSINETEKRFGAAVGLTRIVSSNEFITIASKVDPIYRDKFAMAIKNGITLRVGGSEFSEYIYLMAAESMAFAWNYETNTPIQKIYSDYKSVQSNSVANLLDGIVVENGVFETDTNSSLNFNTYLTEPIENSSHGGNSKIKKATKLTVYRILIEPLPYLIKRIVIEKALKIAVKMGMKHRWNFKWR